MGVDRRKSWSQASEGGLGSQTADLRPEGLNFGPEGQNWHGEKNRQTDERTNVPLCATGRKSCFAFFWK